MGQLGMGEIAVIFIIALLVFGPRKLPELGKSLGKGLREFKKATNELKSTWESQVRDIDREVSSATKDMRDVGRDIENSIKASSPPPAPVQAESPDPVAEATISPATSGSMPAESPAETEEKSSEKPS
jgi:sec-independent protein translocase protein TatA